MDWKLELVVMPVSDVDRAKAFYTEQAGFGLDVDFSAGDEFRVVQLTPRGRRARSRSWPSRGPAPSRACTSWSRTSTRPAPSWPAAGSTSARSTTSRRASACPGRSPSAPTTALFLSFSDPDGNGWLVQEVASPRD
ncbi:MAG: VOC family protein [Gaiellaceae bacterium]